MMGKGVADGTKAALMQKAEESVRIGTVSQSGSTKVSNGVGAGIPAGVSRRSCEAPGSGALIGVDRYHKGC